MENLKIKNALSAKLTVPRQSVKFDPDTKLVKIPCLNLELDFKYLPEFEKINQIEIGKEYTHISVEIQEPQTKSYIAY